MEVGVKPGQKKDPGEKKAVVKTRFVAWRGKIPPVMWLVRKIFPEDVNPHCDLDHEDSNQTLLQNIPAVDAAPQYRVWSQKVQQFRRYGTNSSVLRISAHTVTLTLRIGTQTFCMTLQIMMIPQHTKFHKERGQVVKKILSGQIIYSLRIWTLTVTMSAAPQSKIVKQHSGVLIMHHCTKFGYKRLRTSGGYFLRMWAHTVTLTLDIGTQTFCTTMQVVIDWLIDCFKSSKP